jgi:hypothetical protein
MDILERARRVRLDIHARQDTPAPAPVSRSREHDINDQNDQSPPGPDPNLNEDGSWGVDVEDPFAPRLPAPPCLYGGHRRWRSIYGVVLCAVCQAPAHQGLVAQLL